MFSAGKVCYLVSDENFIKKRQPYWYGHIESINQNQEILAAVITMRTGRDIN
jgi:hypothetical protein